MNFLNIFRRRKPDSQTVNTSKSIGNKYHEIQGMSIEQARSALYTLIDDGNLISVVTATSPFPPAEPLAPELRDLFDKYVSISKIGSEAAIGRELFSPGVEQFRGYFVVGTDIDATIVIVKPGLEGIFVTDGLDDIADSDSGTFVSVYHWFLFTLI